MHNKAFLVVNTKTLFLLNVLAAAYTTRVDDSQLQMEGDKKTSPSVSMDPLKSFLLAVFALTALASFIVFSAYVGIA